MAKIDILFKAVKDLGASDLHLEVGSPPMVRLHGHVKRLEYQTLTKELLSSLIYEILTQEQVREFETNNDLDVAYSAEGIARYRCNIMMKSTGIAGVFRIIPYEIKNLDQLKAPEILKKFCEYKNGLVLVTGPTGSGKSTTLAAMIDYINANEPGHIITLEDPLEFVHHSKKCIISQREIGQHTKSFASALRAALREDPDVVLVGEMRDLETISLAITAAETGHLVFGTLHTRTAPKTVDRIIDVFPQERQSQIRTMLAESLRGVVSQTLLHRADGKGRVACHEIMVATGAVRALIREQKTFQIASAIAVGRKEGMQSLDQSLAELIQQGIITYDEALENCDNATFLARFAPGGAAAAAQAPGNGTGNHTAPAGSNGGATPQRAVTPAANQLQETANGNGSSGGFLGGFFKSS